MSDDWTYGKFKEMTCMECATEMMIMPDRLLKPESKWRTPQYLEPGILVTLQLAEVSGSPVTVYLCTNYDCRAQAAILGDVGDEEE